MTSLRNLAFGLALLCFAAAACAQDQDQQGPGYFRFPALMGDQIVFTAEGDLWTVPLAGGPAHRLTTHLGEETSAVPSPDGAFIAFAATYDGPTEVYVMSSGGGVPERVTFDGYRDAPVGWTQDGAVIYVSQNPIGPAGERVLTTVDPASLERHPIPLADANDGAIADDGRTLYFTRFGLATSGDNVRDYRGGLRAELWRYDLLGKDEALRLPDPDGAANPAGDRRPMPWQDHLYFISDRDGHANLWSMEPQTGKRRQLTRHDDFDIKNANLGQGKIVYQLGSDLWLYDIASQADRKLAITLVSDFAQLRPHLVKNPLDFFESASFAPAGDRAAIAARGRVALVGLDTLRRVDLGIPASGRLRSPVVSPDGRWVYGIVEGGAEGAPAAADAEAPQIWRFDGAGRPDWQVLTHDDVGHRIGLSLSPDGKQLAHWTRDGRLFLLDPESGSNEVVDTAANADLGAVAWSADSRHLAFIRSNSDAERGQLILYEPATKTKSVLTTDRYVSDAPAFSPDGKFLYFLSDRHFDSSNDGPWGDRNMGPFFERRTEIFALALQATAQFPFRPKDELTPAKDKDPAKEKEKPAGPKPAGEAAKEGDADKTKAAEAKPVEPKPVEPGPAIEWDGLARRLWQVPIEAGNYSTLATDGKRLYFLEQGGKDKHTALKTLAIGNDGAKPEEFLGDVREFALSADGQKLFLRRWAEGDKIGDLLIVEAGAKAPSELGKATLHDHDWAFTIDPLSEWRQMFNDAWRLHRDFYYDPAMHKVDWLTIRAKFAPLVERVTDRDELNDVLGQMLTELGTLHSQVAPGDLRKPEDVGKPAFLGGVFRREPGGIRILRIYRSDPELPGQLSPLARPGADIQENDLITEINGTLVGTVPDMAEVLNGQAGNQILLTLARRDPVDPGKRPHFREVKTIVTALDAAQNAILRYSDWETGRRDAVEKASGGRIGYLHLRAMGKNDIESFARDFYAQIDRDALIIDVRRNNGGNIDSWVIEKLLRRAWAFWRPRYGQPNETNMQQTFRGHLAVLVDQSTYSDGETFAAGIKALNLAPLVGKRTAGAGIWLSDDNRLADRGMARVAEFPQYSAKTGERLVENKGVEPDVAVDNLPNATFNGGDAQLDAAVQLLMKQMAADPVKKLE